MGTCPRAQAVTRVSPLKMVVPTGAQTVLPILGNTRLLAKDALIERQSTHRLLGRSTFFCCSVILLRIRHRLHAAGSRFNRSKRTDAVLLVQALYRDDHQTLK